LIHVPVRLVLKGAYCCFFQPRRLYKTNLTFMP